MAGVGRAIRGRVIPATLWNAVPNDPRLWKPTSRQISVTLRSVLRSSSCARSTRRVSTYWCGVSPNASLNRRLKWYGETCAWRASAMTSSGSA